MHLWFLVNACTGVTRRLPSWLAKCLTLQQRSRLRKSSSVTGASFGIACPADCLITVAQLEDALHSVVTALEGLGLPYMLIGGLANLVWGVARTTQDIDITIQADPSRIADTVDALTGAFRALPDDPVSFVHETRVLPVVTDNGTRVDLIFAELPYQEQAIRRARSVRLGRTIVQVCSSEDLIIHKIISERPKDLEDVKGIVRTQRTKLDRSYLDPLIYGLAVDLERPDIQEFYDSLW